MTKLVKNNLGFLGIEFQYKLVKTFMEEPNFFKEIYSIVDQNMFTDPTLKIYVGLLKEYFNKHDLIPSYTMMGIKLHEKAFSEIEIETYDAVLEKIRETSTEGIDEIRELATKFFKQQNFIRVGNEILKLAGDGNIDNFDACLNLMEKAINIGTEDDDLGQSPLDDVEEVLSKDYRITIPTGISGVDQAIEGGLAKGELGVIIGPSSYGKTSMTTAMACYAATHKCEANDNKGFKVLQIVFEDRVKQIQRKYIGRITQVEAKDLSKDEYIDSVKATLAAYPDKEMIKENVRIKKYPSGEVSPSKIKSFIRRMRNNGFSPDLCIIDYFECLVPDKDKINGNENEWSNEGKTMRKLETMAGEFNMALWVPVQGGKNSFGAELLGMEQAGGSVKKVQIAHIIMTIARTMENIKENKATIGIPKNRAGQAGAEIKGVNFNNGTCTITTDNVIDFDDALAYHDNDDEKAQMVKEIYNKNKK